MIFVVFVVVAVVADVVVDFVVVVDDVVVVFYDDDYYEDLKCVVDIVAAETVVVGAFVDGVVVVAHVAVLVEIAVEIAVVDFSADDLNQVLFDFHLKPFKRIFS